jgi:lipopolysaccharide/colanic/teichoic acid biosynthesis glycosyltransferase
VAIGSFDRATSLAAVTGRYRGLVVRTYDVLAAAAAWPLALVLRNDLALDLRTPELLLRDALVVAFLALALFELVGVHRAFWRYATAADLATVGLGVLLLTGAATLVLFLIDRLQAVPRAVPVLFGLVTLLLLATARVGWMLLARRPPAAARASAAATAAAGFHPVLLVGAGDGAALAIDLLRHAGGRGYRPVAVLDDEAALGRSIMGVPVLGRLDELGSVVARLAVQGMRPTRILVTRPAAAFAPEALRALRARAWAERLPLDLLPDLLRLGWAEAPEPAAAPATPAVALPRRALGHALAKRGLDTVVATAVLLLGAPLLLLLAALVAVELGRPVLFTQIRRGRGMVPFTLYKFRTLRDVIDRHGRVLGDAERGSRIGWLLRRTRLDELPQFWNVLVGDMALVGPRPLVDADLRALPDRGRERARLRPGITGWAQVNGGAALGPAEKHALDLWYIHNASLALDLKILALTLRMMLLGEEVNHAEVRRALAALEPLQRLPA